MTIVQTENEQSIYINTNKTFIIFLYEVKDNIIKLIYIKKITEYVKVLTV